MKNVDIIGDIHGHADELKSLLALLGYVFENGYYRHPDNRKVIFVGDYIDRGPKIWETLSLVKAMVDSGSAIALMGNHEYNAVCFNLLATDGDYLRKHTIQNITQHYETLNAFKNKNTEYQAYLEWFMTLPLYYETESYRVVHACWDSKSIDLLRSSLVNDRLTKELIYQAFQKASPLFDAVEIVLKGKEMDLPVGATFTDKDGHIRNNVRVKWWKNLMLETFKSLSMTEDIVGLEDHKIDVSQMNSDYYRDSEKPVFFGHYWLKGEAKLQSVNVCCLDFSVANKGDLVAYRFNGEGQLSAQNFVK